MKSKVNKFNSPNNIRNFSNKLSVIFREMAADLLMELTYASKEKLELTLVGTMPRGSRSEHKQKGFENANVTTIRSEIRNTKTGAEIYLNVLVTEGISRKPHYIWHLINKGFQSGASGQTRRFPLRSGNRTKVRDLRTSAFGGYTGEWRTIRAGERPAPVAPREWYDTALTEIDDEIIKKYGMIFTFKRKEANDG